MNLNMSTSGNIPQKITAKDVIKDAIKGTEHKGEKETSGAGLIHLLMGECKPLFKAKAGTPTQKNSGEATVSQQRDVAAQTPKEVSKGRQLLNGAWFVGTAFLNLPFIVASAPILLLASPLILLNEMKARKEAKRAETEEAHNRINNDFNLQESPTNKGKDEDLLAAYKPSEQDLQVRVNENVVTANKMTFEAMNDINFDDFKWGETPERRDELKQENLNILKERLENNFVENFANREKFFKDFGENAKLFQGILNNSDNYSDEAIEEAINAVNSFLSEDKNTVKEEETNEELLPTFEEYNAKMYPDSDNMEVTNQTAPEAKEPSKSEKAQEKAKVKEKMNQISKEIEQRKLSDGCKSYLGDTWFRILTKHEDYDVGFYKMVLQRTEKFLSQHTIQKNNVENCYRELFDGLEEKGITCNSANELPQYLNAEGLGIYNQLKNSIDSGDPDKMLEAHDAFQDYVGMGSNPFK